MVMDILSVMERFRLFMLHNVMDQTSRKMLWKITVKASGDRTAWFFFMHCLKFMSFGWNDDSKILMFVGAYQWQSFSAPKGKPVFLLTFFIENVALKTLQLTLTISKEKHIHKGSQSCRISYWTSTPANIITYDIDVSTFCNLYLKVNFVARFINNWLILPVPLARN